MPDCLSAEIESRLSAIPSPAGNLLSIPLPDWEPLEEAVRAQLMEAASWLTGQIENQQISPVQLSEAYGLTGKIFHSYDLLETARPCYWNASQLNPLEFQWNYLLGYLEQQSGSSDVAADHYRKALRLKQDYSALYVRLGEIYLNQNRLDDAVESFKQALSERPDESAALYGLGQVALMQGRPGDAVELLNRVVGAVPEATRTHYPLAMAYRERGDLERARHHLALFGPVGIQPVDPLVEELKEFQQGERVQLAIGHRAFNAGDFPAAAKAFGRAAEANPRSVAARVNYGAALVQLGEDQQAVEEFRTALKLEPGNRNARFNLALLAAREGRNAEAAEIFTELAAEYPGDVEVKLRLAGALAGSGNGQAALDLFRELALLGNEEAVLDGAAVLLRENRFEEALNWLQTAHERTPEQGLVAHALSRLLSTVPILSLRDGQRSLDLALRVYEAAPSPPHAETVALALAELGRCQEAAEWQTRALKAAKTTGSAELKRMRNWLQDYQNAPPCRP